MSGNNQTVGLQTDGSLWFWGSINGDNKEIRKRPLPVRMSSDSDWTDIFFGYFTVFAIKSDGTLWCWGCKAKYYTLATDANSDEKPRQVGTDSGMIIGQKTGNGFPPKSDLKKSLGRL